MSITDFGRRKRADSQMQVLDNVEAELKRFAEGGVPAEVEAYAPKPKMTVDLAGQFAEQVRPLVEKITAETNEQVKSLEQQIAILKDHSASIIEAIIDNARSIAEEMTKAKQRAERAAALHSDLVAKSAELDIKKKEPELDSMTAAKLQAESAPNNDGWTQR